LGVPLRRHTKLQTSNVPRPSIYSDDPWFLLLLLLLLLLLHIS